jgi:D-alanine-D-alanine ligase
MKVVVLMGGPSAEREISLATGKAVAGALRSLGHEVSTIDPALFGKASLEKPRTSKAGLRGARGPNDVAGGYRNGGASEQEPAGASKGRGLPGAGDARAVPSGHLGFVIAPEVAECDVVFVALHGEIGEDGKVQAVLDLAGVPYTGSGALASALSMNKDLSKKIFSSQGIPTPEWLLYVVSTGYKTEVHGPQGGARVVQGNSAASQTKAVDPRSMTLTQSELSSLGGFPVVVKPNDQGSTIGLTVVEEEEGLSSAFEKAARYSSEILVERYIAGRELTVSVLGSKALPVVEIIPKGGLYDYERKYTKGASRYVVPAELAPGLERHVRELGLHCFNSLGCRGFGRADMRLSLNNEVFCLEVNTIPGMTETSLVPMAAEAVGISFEELVEQILASATLNGSCQRG